MMTKELEEKLLNCWLSYHAIHEEADFKVFRAGFEACNSEAEKSRVLNNKRKAGELLAVDFISNSEEIQKRRLFLSGVFYTEGKEVVTDGHYMLVNYHDYDSALEGKIINKTGGIIEGQFPKYQRIIPAKEDMIPVDNLTVEDFKIMSLVEKSKSMDKLSCKYIAIDSEHRFAMSTLKMASKFWSCYPSAKLTRHEDKTKMWKLEADNGSMLLFMPCTEGYVQYEYNTTTKVVSSVQ